MSENTTKPTLEGLQADFENMRSQFENFINDANAKGKDTYSDLISRLAHEVHSYSRKAAGQAERLRDAGSAGLDEVGQHVRQNPLASLLIAFGLGCVVSCIFRHLR